MGHIAEAEERFNQLFACALKLCPSLIKALARVHQSDMEQDVERLKQLHEKLLSTVSTSPREIR